MDKIFQVFVSSTFTDLEEERRLVSNSLAKAGYIAAGMELFPATDQDQFEYIKRIIDRSDYYVVITAGRYGSVASDGLSYTEKEYEYARTKGIPVLALIHADPGSVVASKSEATDLGRANLARFNEKLKTGRLTNFWNNKDDLCTKAVIAVTNEANLKPGLGWVRGDNAIDPKILQDFEKLRAENAQLKATISDLRGSLDVEFDPALAGPETEIQVKITQSKTNYPEGPGFTKTDHLIKTTFRGIFLRIHDRILAEPSEYEADKIIGLALCDTGARNVVFDCAHEDTVKVRRQLEALGLIETRAKMTTDNDYFIAWIVTEKGKKYFASHTALKPKTNTAS